MFSELGFVFRLQLNQQRLRRLPQIKLAASGFATRFAGVQH